MLLSMTGFGQGESGDGHTQIVAEVRSVNSRFLDIVTRLPRSLSGFENDVKDLVRQKISRGRINVFVSLQSGDLNDLGVQIDYEVARGYKNMLTNLKEKLDLQGEVRLEHLLTFSEIFSTPNEENGNEQLWGFAKTAILQAIDEMNQMKTQEGGNLTLDLLQRLEKMTGHIDAIESISRQQIPAEFLALKSRINEILQGPDVDRSRLEMEIAMLADRLDVTEECVRFRSHIQLFYDMVNSSELVGRRLNFLLQEMNREANTIGAKANHADISHRVVFIKEEIERLREQVQNIE